MRVDLSKIKGFDWDKANLKKNKLKHGVNKIECEEIFFNQPLVLFPDTKHSKVEKRYGTLGKTNKNRKLALFFTIRDNKIRVISARDQGKQDRKVYEAVEKEFRKAR